MMSSCERCGVESSDKHCPSCAEYLRVLDRGYHRVWLWLYETEKAGKDRLDGRQVEVELPYGEWQPKVVVVTEPTTPQLTSVAVEAQRLPHVRIELRATLVVYERREEWLNKRPYRTYYVRRP